MNLDLQRIAAKVLWLAALGLVVVVGTALISDVQRKAVNR